MSADGCNHSGRDTNQGGSGEVTLWWRVASSDCDHDDTDDYDVHDDDDYDDDEDDGEDGDVIL